MNAHWIGWDVGGAHLKATALDNQGHIIKVVQYATPLWQGLDHLRQAVNFALRDLNGDKHTCHALTMTGELADCFANRQDGVLCLSRTMADSLASPYVHIFAGAQGWLMPDTLTPAHADAIASANWLASAGYACSVLADAMVMDIGSTTTDIFLIREQKLQTRGYTDAERLRYDELVYTGAVRTPVMALTERAPFAGSWLRLTAEHFATTADVYRLTGELPEHADLYPAADGTAKTPEASARRLARMLGHDSAAAEISAWRQLAVYLRETQLTTLRAAVELQLSRLDLPVHAPVVGAGVGRFLARVLAERLQRPYLDVGQLFTAAGETSPLLADCVPAAAVACLGWQHWKH